MKILIATSGYFPTHGGQSTHILNLCKGLKALGNDITVVSLSNYPVPFVKVLHGGLGQILDIVKIGQFYRFKLRQYLLSNIMKQCGNKHGTWDVIDAQDPIALLVAKKLGYRVLLTVHGELTREHLAMGTLKGRWEGRKIIEIEQASYRLADRIVAVDSRLKGHVTQLYQQAENKTSIIYNFIDVKKFSNKVNNLRNEIWDIKRKLNLKTKYIILVPRRLVKKNGVKYAILAMKYAKDLDDVTMIVLGDGPLRNQLNRLVRTGNLENKVKLYGAVEYRDMASYYAIADAVVIPSIDVGGYVEATSLSVIEAMASKVPVIASNIGGLAEIITNLRTGRLVEAHNPTDLADAVRQLLLDKAFSEKLAEQAFSYVLGNHDYLHAAEKFTDICMALLTESAELKDHS